jgi:hypothetical protein
LAQVYSEGNWSGLALALGVAGLLDAAILGSFGWTELFHPALRSALWVVFGVTWLVAGCFSTVWGKFSPSFGRGRDEDHDFCEALAYYLRGNWFEAECALADRLEACARDVDARLMLATLYRRTRRWREAEQQLDLLERCEGAVKWSLEVRRERRWLTDARATMAEGSA